jgi:transposase-like protein
MVRAGRSPAELAKEFEPSDQCIRNWVKQASLDSGLLARQPSSNPLPESLSMLAPAGRWPAG